MGGLRSPPGRFGCSACPVLSSCILSSLPKENLAELEPELRHFSFEAGETIFHQGIPPAGLYILCRGHAKLVFRMPSGRRLLVRVCAPGDFLEGLLIQSLRWRWIRPWSLSSPKNRPGVSSSAGPGLRCGGGPAG